MAENEDRDLKIDKKMGIIWVILIVILVVGGQVAFFIALSML